MSVSVSVSVSLSVAAGGKTGRWFRLLGAMISITVKEKKIPGRFTSYLMSFHSI